MKRKAKTTRRKLSLNKQIVRKLNQGMLEQINAHGPGQSQGPTLCVTECTCG